MSVTDCEPVSIEISDEMASIGASIVHEGTILELGDDLIAERVYKVMLQQAAKENKIRVPDQISPGGDEPIVTRR